MANPNRGEVSLVAGETTYTLVFTINAICEAEEATGQNLLGDLTRLSTLRLMLWAALRTHQPDMTKARAGEIIMAAGVEAAQTAVGEALALAFPKREKAANPR
jgi:hypothetical protein